MPRAESDILADGIARELTASGEELISILRSAAHPDLLEKVRTTGIRDHAQSVVDGLTAALEDYDEIVAAAQKYPKGKG